MPAHGPSGLAMARGRENNRGAASGDDSPGDVGGMRDQDHGADGGDPTFAAPLVRRAPAGPSGA
jgi:hypothetical protein